MLRWHCGSHHHQGGHHHFQGGDHHHQWAHHNHQGSLHKLFWVSFFKPKLLRAQTFSSQSIPSGLRVFRAFASLLIYFANNFLSLLFLLLLPHLVTSLPQWLGNGEDISIPASPPFAFFHTAFLFSMFFSSSKRHICGKMEMKWEIQSWQWWYLAKCCCCCYIHRAEKLLWAKSKGSAVKALYASYAYDVTNLNLSSCT